MNCLALPDHHYPAWLATQRYQMSLGEHVGALIDREEGRPNKLDGMQQGDWLSKSLRTPKATHGEKSDTPNRHPT